MENGRMVVCLSAGQPPEKRVPTSAWARPQQQASKHQERGGVVAM
nr:unnamed protein product [Digitaria exilis]